MNASLLVHQDFLLYIKRRDKKHMKQSLHTIKDMDQNLLKNAVYPTVSKLVSSKKTKLIQKKKSTGNNINNFL